MKPLTIHLPLELNEAQEKDLKLAIAAILFDKGLLSSGQAAEFAGTTKREFLEQAGRFGVSIFGESEQDLSS